MGGGRCEPHTVDNGMLGKLRGMCNIRRTGTASPQHQDQQLQCVSACNMCCARHASKPSLLPFTCVCRHSCSCSCRAMAFQPEDPQTVLAHVENKYQLAAFKETPECTRTTAISMSWFTAENQGKLMSSLDADAWTALVPPALRNTIKQHKDHPCPDLAHAATMGTVFEFGAALLTQIFLACCGVYKKWARALQQQHATAHTLPQWVLSGIAANATRTVEEQHTALWHRLVPDQQAALLLFTSPPVRRHAGQADKDACVRLYKPSEYKCVTLDMQWLILLHAACNAIADQVLATTQRSLLECLLIMSMHHHAATSAGMHASPTPTHSSSLTRHHAGG